jgi:hypothetical protein
MLIPIFLDNRKSRSQRSEFHMTKKLLDFLGRWKALLTADITVLGLAGILWPSLIGFDWYIDRYLGQLKGWVDLYLFGKDVLTVTPRGQILAPGVIPITIIYVILLLAVAGATIARYSSIVNQNPIEWQGAIKLGVYQIAPLAGFVLVVGVPIAAGILLSELLGRTSLFLFLIISTCVGARLIAGPALIVATGLSVREAIRNSVKITLYQWAGSTVAIALIVGTWFLIIEYTTFGYPLALPLVVVELCSLSSIFSSSTGRDPNSSIQSADGVAIDR